MRKFVGLLLACLLCGCLLVFGQEKQEKKGVSKDELQARLTALQQGRDQALANYNAILGAIQLCQDLLNEVNTTEKPSEPKAAVKTDPPSLKSGEKAGKVEPVSEAKEVAKAEKK